MLTRCMDISHIRADSHAIQIGNAVGKQAALNTGMDSFHRGFLVKERLICRQYRFFYDGMRIIRPPRIIAIRRSRTASQLDDSGNLLNDPFFLRRDRTSNRIADRERVLFQL